MKRTSKQINKHRIPTKAVLEFNIENSITEEQRERGKALRRAREEKLE